ncbi:Cna B-type domain-containing protein [Bariatricus sp. SGI.161]|uniref:Cna B-type domain-containing protein n=1 Tax=Bariatricus sp. SGI.161 TaxID=3420550 RepID=UPI003D02104D
MLGCAVVFCTTYVLILPAITLDKGSICGLEEHEHTDSCYRTVEKVSRLACTAKPHEHTEKCYDEEGNVICGYADYFIHTHNSSCYQDDELVCKLPEITDENPHEHTEECYDADGNLICGKLEVLEHVHDDSCFETVETEVEPVLICEKTEHLHSDACFEKDAEEEEAEEGTAVNLAEGSQTAVIYTDSSCEEISDDATVITVGGNLPENARVCAYPVDISTEQASEQMVLCAYDISIVLEDGTIYEPAEGESLKVSIQSSELDPDKLDKELTPKIYYVPEKGEPEPIDTTVNDDEVSFDAEHFSVYMLLAVNANEVSTAEQLKTAIASGNENIKLKTDISVSEGLTITANANITLDLNGRTLSASGTAALFTIPENAVLTIVNSQQGTETVTATSGSLAGNTATLSEDSLTYYVTTTSVKNSATGATQEALEKRTVSTAGAIVGGSRPVFQVTGGTLNIQSGMIRGGTGRAITQTSGTTNMSGGYICGFTQSSSKTDNTSFGGAVKASGGTLNLSGSVLAGNTAHNGGAIYATGSTKVFITSSVISGNTANRTTRGWNDHSESGAYRCGGGGIYSDTNAEITMNGGYITNNVATHDGYFDGGGGVCLSGTSSMALSGGYVTGNQAQGGGGIRTDYGKATTFVMTGGFVSANVATHSEGGGVAIDRNGVGTVTGGYITNNQIPNTGHWGGGGLFCADGSTLNLKNTLITENTAGGFGAGVAGCPTGNLYLYVTEGCAIYDNTDTVDGDSPHFTSDGVKQIDKEICTEVFQSNGHADFFCALNSTVTGTMLGNNAANWQGSADYQPVIADAEDVLTASRVMGLQAHPTEEAKSAAKSAAKVFINGNYSYTHGGGIMCNGNLVIGVPVNIEVPARVELQATKKLVDGSGNAQSLEDNDFTFKVTMTELDGTVIASGTCDSSGKITFDHQLTFKQEGTFVYYIYEETDEGNTSIKYDSTLYRLTVTVERDDGVTWYGDTIKYTYSVTSVKVESSKDGETWNQISQSDTSQSGIISLPLTSGTTFTNHLVEPTKITVQKKWEGGSGTDSVTVILKKDGEEVERRTLDADNNWTYTWDDLEPGHEYTVEEVEVPGYTASYEITTSLDDSGSTSLGQGSWWVPATELTVGQQYLIVSADGTKALYIASNHENRGFDTSDVKSVIQQTGNLEVNGNAYNTWYATDGIDSRCIFTAQTREKEGHTGTILKCNGTSANTWLLVQAANSNHLKSTSGANYASNMMFENGMLKGHENYGWNPTDLRTVIYADGKFNTTTEQNPANAAKLYTLVTGEGFTGTTTDSSTVVITNTREGGDYELPETGGKGTYYYTIGGLLLMGAALMWGFGKRRKRERRID